MRYSFLPGALLLVFAVGSSLAQSAPSPMPLPGRFCVVRSIGSLGDKRPGFTLDYGVPTKTNKLPDTENYALTFKVEALRSVPDMLNFMDNLGWELVQTTAVATAGQATATSNTASYQEYQYIFRRKMK